MYTTMTPEQRQAMSPFSIAGKSLDDPNASTPVAPVAPMEDKAAMLGKMLSKAQQGDPKATQYVNGWAVKNSPMAGMGDTIQSLADAYKAYQATKSQTQPVAPAVPAPLADLTSGQNPYYQGQE